MRALDALARRTVDMAGWRGSAAQLVRSLNAAIRASGAVKDVAELADDQAAVTGAAWRSIWPDVLDAILLELDGDPEGVVVSADVQRGMVRAGEVLEDWPGPDVMRRVVEIAADAYGSGKTQILDSAGLPVPRSVDVLRVVVDPTTGLTSDALFAEILGEELFGQADQRAAEWLAEDTMFWVGDAWDNGLGTQIGDAALVTLQTGARRAGMVKLLKSTLNDRFARSDDYWDIVAASTMNRARTFGAVGGFEEAGSTAYKLLTVPDERRSEICEALDGTVFEVRHAVELRDKVMASQGPDELKAAHPWHSTATVLDLKEQGPGALAASGVALPPFHGL